jgi:hypothetical protein
MTTTITHDYHAARGGFWVKADGTTVPVRCVAGHASTIRHLKGEGLFPGKPAGDRSGEHYSDAFKLGWVHVTFCSHTTFEASYWIKTATVAALRTVVALLRHYEAEEPGRFKGAEVRAEASYHDTEAYKRYEAIFSSHEDVRAEARKEFPQLTGGLPLVAGQVAKIALERNAAEKAALKAAA